MASVTLSGIQAAAVLDQAAIIPLTLIAMETAGGDFAGYKVGISVEVTVPMQAGYNAANQVVIAEQLYEFDTGGPGFWVDVTQQSTSFFENISASYGNVQTQYFSGIEYTGIAAAVSVSFPAGTNNGAGALNFSVPVGLVETIQNIYDHPPDSFPIFGNFYGDFGAGLFPSGSAGGNQPLLGVLSQISNAIYGQGFVVALPAFSTLVTSSGTMQPTNTDGFLVLGLGKNLRSLLSGASFAMTALGQYQSPMAGGPQVNTYKETLLTDATVKLTYASGSLISYRADGVGVCFDTGVPITTLHPGTALPVGQELNIPPVLLPAPTAGDTFALSATTVAGSSYPLMSETVGAETANAQINTAGSVSANDPKGYVNTGVGLFLNNFVMFDLIGGTITVVPSS